MNVRVARDRIYDLVLAAPFQEVDNDLLGHVARLDGDTLTVLPAVERRPRHLMRMTEMEVDQVDVLEPLVASAN